jgi:hypothetical protein
MHEENPLEFVDGLPHVGELAGAFPKENPLVLEAAGALPKENPLGAKELAGALPKENPLEAKALGAPLPHVALEVAGAFPKENAPVFEVPKEHEGALPENPPHVAFEVVGALPKENSVAPAPKENPVCAAGVLLHPLDAFEVECELPKEEPLDALEAGVLPKENPVVAGAPHPLAAFEFAGGKVNGALPPWNTGVLSHDRCELPKEKS